MRVNSTFISMHKCSVIPKIIPPAQKNAGVALTTGGIVIKEYLYKKFGNPPSPPAIGYIGLLADTCSSHSQVLTYGGVQ